MDWMLMPLRRYAQFSGRSRRKEYWMYILFLVIASFILQTIERMMGFQSMITGPQGASSITGLQVGGTGPVSGLFGLATLIPGIAVTVRRLHDTNRSGWWVGAFIAAYVALIGFTLSYIFYGAGGQGPNAGIGTFATMGVAGFAILILGLVLLVFMCLNGTQGENRYGPDPKGDNLADVFA